ncbi:phosphotransferase [Clostridium sp.]|uniref:phosphotransferase n=1 Tax=Clostridium sp. TaxID=1506 RepID=UPI002FC8B82E
MDNIEVLKVLNKNPIISQREVAQKSNLSLGKINFIIGHLLDLDYIYCEKMGKGVKYQLTEKGIEALEENIKNNRDIKINIHNNEFKTVKQAVILAAGRKLDFDRPVGFLKVEEDTFINRTLNILKDNGIEKIVIITGYKNEYFQDFAKQNSLILVNNEKYKWTGTMNSLSLAREHISDDFILIEDDILIEESAIKQLLNSEERDCIMITSESGSGDEAFVELRDEHLYKISKDIHQLNKIHGEMIGVSKISLQVFNKMMEDYKYNKNPYLNYEYLLLDVARSYEIGYIKIDDLVWAEVDNNEHYNRIIRTVYPRLKRKEMEIRIEQIKNDVVDAIKVNYKDITSVVPFGGMTNKNFKVTISGEDYVLRIPGNGTEEMINRLEEIDNVETVKVLGIDAEIVYFGRENGIKIAKYIEDAETLNGKTAKREENMKLTSAVLKTLHTSNIVFKNRFDVFKKIEEYEVLLEKAKGKNYEDYYEVKEKVMALKALQEDLDLEICPCHNDGVPENFIKSGEDKIYLIDWEYSGMNDPMWDLAAHSIECNFSEDDEELFLSFYFNGEVKEKYRKRILINKICQDFLWSTWTNIKEAKGDDFGTYGIDRYNRAKENLEKI